MKDICSCKSRKSIITTRALFISQFLEYQNSIADSGAVMQPWSRYIIVITLVKCLPSWKNVKIGLEENIF